MLNKKAKYFRGLKRNWENVKKVQFSRALQRKKLLANCVEAWFQIADRKSKRNEILFAYTKYRNFEIRKYVFHVNPQIFIKFLTSQIISLHLRPLLVCFFSMKEKIKNIKLKVNFIKKSTK